MTNDLLIYGENINAFPHILGSPSSYMTLHPIPSELPFQNGLAITLAHPSGNGEGLYVLKLFLPAFAAATGRKEGGSQHPVGFFA